MIEVISVRCETEAGHTPRSSDDARILSAAARFFADRLLTRKQQRRLKFLIQFTAAPHRHPVDMAAFIGEPGLFGFRRPRSFKMTASSATGMRDAFESVAVEMVHVAQVATGRLMMFTKNRKFKGAGQPMIAARWLGKRETIVDAMARTDCPWVTEAVKTAARLVDEFMALAASETTNVPGRKATDRQIGLHPVKAGVSFRNILPAFNDMNALKSGTSHANPNDTGPANVENKLAVEARLDDSATCRRSMPEPSLDLIELPVGPEFTIAVPVAGLKQPRQLDSSVLFGKVNDLLERGLILRESARAAIRSAESRRSK